jgi:hypothetical protein
MDIRKPLFDALQANEEMPDYLPIRNVQAAVRRGHFWRH